LGVLATDGTGNRNSAFDEALGHAIQRQTLVYLEIQADEIAAIYEVGVVKSF
jgi:hypothetical protein